MSHTRGPWYVYDQAEDDGAEYGCHIRAPNDPLSDWVAQEIFNRDDARLIAASPKLLEACKLALSRLQAHGEWDDGCFYYNRKSASELQEPIRQLEAAIAEAEGHHARANRNR